MMFFPQRSHPQDEEIVRLLGLQDLKTFSIMKLDARNVLNEVETDLRANRDLIREIVDACASSVQRPMLQLEQMYDTFKRFQSFCRQHNLVRVDCAVWRQFRRLQRSEPTCRAQLQLQANVAESLAYEIKCLLDDVQDARERASAQDLDKHQRAVRRQHRQRLAAAGEVLAAKTAAGESRDAGPCAEIFSSDESWQAEVEDNDEGRVVVQSLRLGQGRK